MKLKDLWGCLVFWFFFIENVGLKILAIPDKVNGEMKNRLIYYYDFRSQLLKQRIYVIGRKRLQSKSEGQQSQNPIISLHGVSPNYF
jgi:hypothetical protein